MDHFLKMFRLTNMPTVPVSEEEIGNDADEPPDDQVPDLNTAFKKENIYSKNIQPPALGRRESLLTRAIQGGAETSLSSSIPVIPRGLSTTSSHSFASTAELTSDAESPARSASPSPPPPLNRLELETKPVANGKVMIAPITQDDKPTLVETGEAAVEKTLGRKRCIMFACRGTRTEDPKETKSVVKIVEPSKVESAPRKCRISFACPSRPATETAPKPKIVDAPRRQSSPAPSNRKPMIEIAQPRRATEGTPSTHVPKKVTVPTSPISPRQPVFHEFGSSHDEPEEWVQKADEAAKTKLTIDDCWEKENAIRKLGKEAEEEAEEEERQQDELENELEEEDNGEDDFAPSDEDEGTDGGNESDDEGGFADSDSESELGSEYQFWAPSTTTAATSAENLTHFSSRQKTRSRASSTSSNESWTHSAPLDRFTPKATRTKPIRMRPGTPELPDSTDFVCGTFDEDRPMEAAYISCREQRRREKHIPIPQDIDPSFPTSDPGEEVDEEEGTAESSEQQWIQKQFEDFDDSSQSRRPSAIRLPSVQAPAPVIAGPRHPVLAVRQVCRSPPPKHHIAKSPAPRRLFDHPPKRLRSPPPVGRLRSPRGSPTGPKGAPFGITINHLAQRPNAVKTSSLPHTPNPFFRNWQNGKQPISRLTSGTSTPGTEDIRPDLHVRGPVDIVIGLEKKRQKRKEKYWRQNCRKTAKENAGKKPAPGRGAERMKELGLECAERTRGYGLGQPAQLVLSL